MGKTTFIGWHDDGFWVYDVGLGIFLKHLIDIADAYNGRQEQAWLDECIDRWRVNAVVGELGMYLDEHWSQEQIAIVASLIDDACGILLEREFISAEEVASWVILDGDTISCLTRGAAEFPTAPVIELGLAVKVLIGNTMPLPPDGTWWFYGSSKGLGVIQKRR